MGKVISATTLRTQLSSLLDELKCGQTHFIIERNNEAVGVLLSMEKFQDIMQTLELINNLEYLPTEGLEGELLPEELSQDFPEPMPQRHTKATSTRSTTRSNSESIESVAAKLGIRLIK
ncbi:MAG: type II toxin-antitoxin system Phd/YefM family antitoxin [Chloroflexota bacterium]